jgi:DNA-binding CsgD family transcriptional regulator
MGPASRAILIVDAPGTVFAALREARLGVALWRWTGAPETADGAGFAVAIVAVYERPDWDVIAAAVHQAPTVIVTTRHDEDDAQRALMLGVFGYISASLPPGALRRAILGALNGEPAYSRRLLAHELRSRARAQLAGKTLSLTSRQLEVLMLIANGAADKEIAGRLTITTATAQKHVTNLLRRLNVPNRAAAAALLVRSMSAMQPTQIQPIENAAEANAPEGVRRSA